MKKILVIMVLVLTVSLASASGNFALGIRGGNFSGISLRSLNNGRGTEFLLTAGTSGFKIAGLYESHYAVDNAQGLTWFCGFGLHTGLSGTNFETSTVSFGVDAIIGIEYSFEPAINLPVSISLDYKPAFDIIGGWGTNWAGVAGTIRYIF
ncbi:MAG: hypothetical protein U5N26_12370 [Candidatus Marinimicrobia bacterium]|nr:hypothetical protein [Candidatus Neomarinimicrobiota bacterium]